MSDKAELDTWTSEFFTRDEFACKCGCGQDTVDAELLHLMETLRGAFERPITITSGNRCLAHNARIGGSEFSYHLKSKACDFIVKDVDPKQVYEVVLLLLNHRGEGGVGLYDDWVHVDVREGALSKW